jgi:hypothetical protein
MIIIQFEALYKRTIQDGCSQRAESLHQISARKLSNVCQGHRTISYPNT